MRLFAALMALLGIVVCLVANFSFWPVFGALYAVVMVVVITIAYTGGRGHDVQAVWNDSTDLDNDESSSVMVKDKAM